MPVKNTKTGDLKRSFNRKSHKTFKKSCSLCSKGINHVDYKGVELLNNYVVSNGRILPRRITGLCAKHQKMITNAVKRARIVALMPFVKE